MLLNNIISLSQRVHIENGEVIIDKIESFDIVENPVFSNAIIDFSDINDLHRSIQERLKREKLLKNRK